MLHFHSLPQRLLSLASQRQLNTFLVILLYYVCLYRFVTILKEDIDLVNFCVVYPVIDLLLIIISFYARSKNKNKINVWLETYPASSDNNYGVQIEFKKEASLTPQWNKYTFNISISSFDKVLIGKDGQCASFLQFRMIDKSIDYDWEIGGIMVSTKAPYFELTPYTE